MDTVCCCIVIIVRITHGKGAATYMFVFCVHRTLRIGGDAVVFVLAKGFYTSIHSLRARQMLLFPLLISLFCSSKNEHSTAQIE